jgi:hypothetical protein
VQRLLAELVADSHKPPGVHRRFLQQVQLQMRIGIGNGRQDAVKCLLDRVGEEGGKEDDPVVRLLIELVLQSHGLIEGVAFGDVGVEMIEHYGRRRCRGAAAALGSGRQLGRVPGRALLSSRSLPEREWDQAHGQQQKQVKRASSKMRFNRGVNALFHNSACVWSTDRNTDPKWDSKKMSRLFSLVLRNDAAFAQSVIPSEVEESLD